MCSDICCFSLHFSDKIGCRAPFHYLICHLYIFFGEVSDKVSCLFFNQFVFLLLSFDFFVYFGQQFLIRCFFCKYLSPVCGMSSNSLDTVFHKAAVFNFNEIQLISYFFMDCAFGVASFLTISRLLN